MDYNSINVIRIDIDKNKEKALNVALNKISGEWDFGKLTDLLKEIKEVKEEDFLLTGFDTNELEKLMNDFQKENINDNSDKYDDNFDEQKAKEEIVKPVTKQGDYYQIGNHILLCGDTFNERDLNKLLSNHNIDMVFTDPPYDMAMGGQGCFADSTTKVKKRLEKLIHFDVTKLSFMPKIKTYGIGTFYIFTSKDGIKDYLKIFDDYKFNMLFWGKTNSIPMTNNGFIPDLEYLLCFTNDKKKWNNSLKPSSVYKKYYITSIQAAKKEDGDLHPTMKPLELIVDKIRISSSPGGYVLDLFGGSGSTMIACERVERKCLMMEVEPCYCDVIIKRYIQFKGSSDDVFLIENNGKKKTKWKDISKYEPVRNDKDVKK